MERICSLFFELSNEDRLSIILRLMNEPMKLTSLAKEFGLSAQECSRQLSRLSEIDLVTKTPDGNYVLQPYGMHALMLFPGFHFLNEHIEYFNKHILTKLPTKFKGRIGELRGCKPLTELMGTFSNIERVMREAEEFFWHISDETLLSSNTYMIGLEALDRGVQIKAIERVEYNPEPDIVLSISDKAKERFAVHRGNSMLMNRRLEQFDVALYMSEKEVAVLAFPLLSGEFDYHGFTSKDPYVIEWCKDIHNYYWEKGIREFGH